ncbi:MAG: hypothetical protein WC517_03385 [Patescibacteria group bacterium]
MDIALKILFFIAINIVFFFCSLLFLPLVLPSKKEDDLLEPIYGPHRFKDWQPPSNGGTSTSNCKCGACYMNVKGKIKFYPSPDPLPDPMQCRLNKRRK